MCLSSQASRRALPASSVPGKTDWLFNISSAGTSLNHVGIRQRLGVDSVIAPNQAR